MIDNKKRGRLNKARGARFELRTRKDLEEQGWIVDKWSNQVETTVLIDPVTMIAREDSVKKLIPAKRKWAGPGRPMMMGAGFPDFIAMKSGTIYDLDDHVSSEPTFGEFDTYSLRLVIGVECKVGKYLDKEEKEKCNWLLKNNVFSKILIAYPEKQGRKIVVKYKEYK